VCQQPSLGLPEWCTPVSRHSRGSTETWGERHALLCARTVCMVTVALVVWAHPCCLESSCFGDQGRRLSGFMPATCHNGCGGDGQARMQTYLQLPGFICCWLYPNSHIRMPVNPDRVC
jgi:hypothetical protein